MLIFDFRIVFISDLKDLRAIQVPTLGWKTNFNASQEIKQGEVHVLDTQRYTSALMQQRTGGRLGKMAESCEIEGGMKMSDMKLHNAGEFSSALHMLPSTSFPFPGSSSLNPDLVSSCRDSNY